MSPDPRHWLAPGLAVLAVLASAVFGELARSAAPGSATELALRALALELLIGLGACAAALLSTQPFGARLGLGRSRLPWSSLILLAIGALALSHALEGALALSGMRERTSLAQLEARLAGLRGGELAFALLGIGVAPGIAEELLCRGLVQRGLVKRLGSTGAIAVAAVLFGWLHVEPIHAALAAVLGLYLGVVAHWADSTRAAIGCHTANNLASVGLTAGLAPLELAPAATAGPALALALLCLWAVRRRTLASRRLGGELGRPGGGPSTGNEPATPADALQPRSGSDDR